MKNLDKILDVLGAAIVEQLQAELAYFKLKDSDIYKNIDYTVKDGLLTFSMPDYWVYIENGRKPGGEMPPVSSLIKRMKKKRIATGNENSVVFAIAKAIQKRGIKARPFVKNALGETAELFDAFALDFSKLIDNEIEQILKKI